jgi:hypothetical protein
LPITSEARFSPLGPQGMGLLYRIPDCYLGTILIKNARHVRSVATKHGRLQKTARHEERVFTITHNFALEIHLRRQAITTLKLTYYNSHRHTPKRR